MKAIFEKIKRFRWPSLSQAVHTLFLDKMYLLVLFSIFIKSVLFIGLMGTQNATGIHFTRHFLSAFPFVLYFVCAMFVSSFAFLFKGRGRIWALIVIDILISILFIGDVWYFRGYSGFLNFFLLSMTSNLDNLGSSVMSMYRPIDIVFVIDIILLIIFMIYNGELYRGVKRSLTLFIATFLIPVLFVTFLHYKIDVYKRGLLNQFVFLQSWAPTETMENLGPIGYHLFDGYKYYENTRPFVLSEQQKGDINAWFDKNNEKLPDNNYAGMFKGKNLIVIQFESLENFVIGQKIDGQEITPNINKLLKNSLYFNNYHENIYNGTSSDADLMTNAGVYPVRMGSTFFRFPNNKYKNSLPKVMGSMGYSTLAVHPDLGSYWNWMPALQSIGFQKCIDAKQFTTHVKIGLGIADHDYMEQLAPIVKNEKQPYYTFLVTLTSHGPFELPGEYRTMKLSSDIDYTILGDYFQSIHYTDEAIGKFLDTLQKDGTLDNTVVVVYGDHTSVHKYYPDKADAVKPSQDWWMHNDMRIPLIIYNPSVKGETIDIQGGQIDLMPTIEYLMGAKKEQFQRDAIGKVLVNTKKNYTILQNYTMYGKYTPEDEKHAKEAIDLSNIMVQSNYFKGN